MFSTVFSRITMFLGASALFFASVSSAQTCSATVNGFYSYSAIGNGIPGALLTTGTSTTGTGATPGAGSSAGTTAATPPFTNTGVGQLVSGATNSGPFASAGTLYFDGSGNIRAGSTPQSQATTSVGTYVVNSDCTITVTLTDAFGTNTTAAKLQGIILGNGSEIDLGVIQNTSANTGTGGTGSTSTAPGVFQSNLLIRLVRPLATFCSTSNLSGFYALVATGTRVANVNGTGAVSLPTQTEASFFLFGRVQFDGNGNILSPSTTPSSLGFLQFAGSYTVNSDCSGTMTLTSVSTTSTGTGNVTGSGSVSGSTTTSSSALNVNFVLTQPNGPFTGSRPGILFSQSNGTQTLFGYGMAQ